MTNHDDSFENFSETRSNITRLDEVDYEKIQINLAEQAEKGVDLDALRAKIQHEARLLMEANEVTSTEVKQIVHRDIRLERSWKDHIRLNLIRYEGPDKTIVMRRPEIWMIVRIQALVRGFLARRNRAKRPVWNLLFDFVVHQNNNYYHVRVFKAPE